VNRKIATTSPMNTIDIPNSIQRIIVEAQGKSQPGATAVKSAEPQKIQSGKRE
jgi:hypothetical protein